MIGEDRKEVESMTGSALEVGPSFLLSHDVRSKQRYSSSLIKQRR